MRIVGGALSGRRFSGPRGSATRPTSERVREAIASAILSRGGFEGCAVLDVFAGTGAYAFEALSRGAERAVLVERDGRAAKAIEASARELGVGSRVAVVVGDANAASVHARIKGPFERVFIDPPYAEIAAVEGLIRALDARGLLAEDALIVVEHASKSPPTFPPTFDIVSSPRYGDTAVMLLRRKGEEST